MPAVLPASLLVEVVSLALGEWLLGVAWVWSLGVWFELSLELVGTSGTVGLGERSSLL